MKWLWITVLLTFAVTIEAVKPDAVSQEMWEALVPHFLPEEHPAKSKLDALFSKRTATTNHQALKKAGFFFSERKKECQVVVATHQSLPGFCLKVHLDCQPTASDASMCLKRIKGAALLRQKIEELRLCGSFKVPQKWVYQLPGREKLPAPYKQFILVVENMHIIKNGLNIKAWRSKKMVTKEKLTALFTLLNTLGMRDLVYIDNIPFSVDGKIAFVDTENFSSWPVPFLTLMPWLPKEHHDYWKQLNRKKKR